MGANAKDEKTRGSHGQVGSVSCMCSLVFLKEEA